MAYAYIGMSALKSRRFVGPDALELLPVILRTMGRYFGRMLPSSAEHSAPVPPSAVARLERRFILTGWGEDIS